MAKITVNIPDNMVKLGKDLIGNDSVRNRFNEDPVAVLREYGLELPEDMTSEKLQEFRLKDMLRELQNIDRTAMRNAAAAEVVIEAAMTPYTVPVVEVVIAVGVASTVGE
jgi:hypothetical protein